MDIILNNPFRVLGVPVNASERKIKKNIQDFIENEIALKIVNEQIKNNTLFVDIKNKKIIAR